MKKRQQKVEAVTDTPAPQALTLGALVSAEPALMRLAEIRLPIRESYQVIKTLRQVQAETKLFHEQRAAWIKELGQERPATLAEGGQDTVFQVPPANRPEFMRRLNELGAVTVDLLPRKIHLSGIEVSAMDLLALEPFIHVDDDAAADSPAGTA